MTINQFIRTNSIRPADAIVMQKKFFGMVDHYAIYIGYYNGEPQFVANYTKGVQVIDREKMSNFLQVLVPVKIDRFKGSEYQRKIAVKRALSQRGKKAYSYIHNNCEHFKNWVQTGKPRSEQIEKVTNGLAVGATVFAGIMLIGALFGGD